MTNATNVTNETISKDARLTQAERTEISDQRMFDTAVSLINERGPAATRLSDVGVLAGYSRGLASHRFGSKDSLFNFVVLRVGDIWLEQLKHATRNQSGFAAIEKAVDQHYQFCLDAPAHLRAFYTLWFESVNAESELSNTIQKIHQRRFQDVVNWVLADDETGGAEKTRCRYYCCAIWRVNNWHRLFLVG